MTPTSRLAPVFLLTLLFTLSQAADAERLAMQHTRLDLPGAPVAIVAADLDADGDRDLVLAIAYTEWDQLAIDESTTMDGVEGLVEVMTIVPALADRRELHILLADPDADDGYSRFPAIELGKDILTLAAGPPSAPVIALTDRGLSALRFDGSAATFEPLVDEPPVFAGTGVFLPNLDLAHDLDADGRVDVLLPSDDGYVVYLATDDGFRSTDQLELPTGRYRSTASGSHRHYPRPEVRDLSGDGLPDLVFIDPHETWADVHTMINLGDGRFAAPESVDWPTDAPHRPVWFGALDRHAPASWVSAEELSDPDASWREEMREAKEPKFRYRVHPADRPIGADSAEKTFEGKGYALGIESGCGADDEDFRIPGGFLDLDGDDRLDLVSVTLDFSMMQALRVLATQTISIGLDFHVHCQTDDGGFRRVPNLDLSGKFRINLNDVRVRRLSLFDGDFDGDGRLDFVQLGRGRNVTIHLGRDGCGYAPQPDLTLRLEDSPKDLSLVRIDDLDGDGRSDLLVVQPGKRPEAGVTVPVRLDLYTSTAETR